MSKIAVTSPPKSGGDEFLDAILTGFTYKVIPDVEHETIYCWVPFDPSEYIGKSFAIIACLNFSNPSDTVTQDVVSFWGYGEVSNSGTVTTSQYYIGSSSLKEKGFFPTVTRSKSTGKVSTSMQEGTSNRPVYIADRLAFRLAVSAYNTSKGWYLDAGKVLLVLPQE